MESVAAIKLRSAGELKIVPNNNPGWYRWWAPVSALKDLLGAHFCELNPLLTKGHGTLANFSYIYVGVAIKESIQARLNWHVNQIHKFGCIKHGTLSTLRQSISSLAGSSQGDEATTNRVMDLLSIEYSPVDMPIRSLEAKKHIEEIERNEMVANLLPLNIQHNHHPAIAEFKKSLKAARKAAKQKYLLSTNNR